MLITNSDYHYTNKMMSFAYNRFMPPGSTWRDLFDMVSFLCPHQYTYCTSCPLWTQPFECCWACSFERVFACGLLPALHPVQSCCLLLCKKVPRAWRFCLQLRVLPATDRIAKHEAIPCTAKSSMTLKGARSCPFKHIPLGHLLDRLLTSDCDIQ